MKRAFQEVLQHILFPGNQAPHLPLVDIATQFRQASSEKGRIGFALNAAFLIALSGKEPDCREAFAFLQSHARKRDTRLVAHFYLRAYQEIFEEADGVAATQTSIADRFRDLSDRLGRSVRPFTEQELAEQMWRAFFPEAVGIRGAESIRIQELRRQRLVTIHHPNPSPLKHPARQLLFTANVLLTLPPASRPIEKLPLSPHLQSALKAILTEPQQFWYDHPIPVGVPPEQNEVIYGLRGLDQAMAFEVQRGHLKPGERIPCILSISVTHEGLQRIAVDYLLETLQQAGPFPHLDIFFFSERETRMIIHQVLAPAAQAFLNQKDPSDLLFAFGVDGEYGRHFSFLKAVAALWQVLVRPETKATFKIDLDQVFPQDVLIQETGFSALEHFRTALWGATGKDATGHPVELGMIAGALVNQKDIHRSLFTPDVPFPQRTLAPDEFIFCSVLPQALSTRAEMMARYGSNPPDGKTTCLQRVHVTGGTTGILVDALRRHRPFTPGFIGRAEDQAYLLSVLANTPPRLAYLHKDGLIMRHDKEAFAGPAIQMAAIGKLIGDYIRILYFSAYARALSGDIHAIKSRVDPFTGCFISPIPRIVTLLRFALKATHFYQQSRFDKGHEFIQTGARRLRQALDFISGNPSPLAQQLSRERRGWQLYYDTIQAIETQLATGHPLARELQERFHHILQQVHLEGRVK